MGDQLEELDIPKNDRLWLVFSHADQSEISRYLAFFQKKYETLEVRESEQAAVVLLKAKK